MNWIRLFGFDEIVTDLPLTLHREVGGFRRNFVLDTEPMICALRIIVSKVSLQKDGWYFILRDGGDVMHFAFSFSPLIFSLRMGEKYARRVRGWRSQR